MIIILKKSATKADADLLLGIIAEQGLEPLPEGTVRDFIGRGITHLVERSLVAAGLPLPCERLEPALQGFGKHYARLNGRASRPFPGVLEALERLRAAPFKLACVTNKDSAFTMPLLEKSGLARFFDAVSTSDRARSRKPEPGLILHACRALQTDPREAVVIGDSANDAGAARAAGCRVLLVSYGYSEGRDVRSLESDGVVATLGEAAGLLLD